MRQCSGGGPFPEDLGSNNSLWNSLSDYDLSRRRLPSWSPLFSSVSSLFCPVDVSHFYLKPCYILRYSIFCSFAHPSPPSLPAPANFPCWSYFIPFAPCPPRPPLFLLLQLLIHLHKFNFIIHFSSCPYSFTMLFIKWGNACMYFDLHMKLDDS